MNASQFISEFDVLYNNVMSNQSPGLDNYEKGVFLTKAQNEFLIDAFSINNNTQDGGFDATQKRQYDFSRLIKIQVCDSDTDKVSAQNGKAYYMHPKGERYKLNDDFFFIVNEEIITANKVYSIYPLHYLEYKRLMMKPYQMPPKNVVWRLLVGQIENSSSSNKTLVELIGTPNVGYSYKIRYVKRPKPIVLYRPDEGDPDVELLDIDVDDIDLDNPCELPEETHHEILDRAVALAKEAYTGTQQTQKQYDKQRTQ